MEELASMGPKSTPQFSLEEIKAKAQNEKKSLIVIEGRVYDVTKYKESHPGGPELIEECEGDDATTEFWKHSHSGSALEELEKYQVGILRE